MTKATDLSLEVSTTLNVKNMRLFDTSFYHKDETVDNYLVEVLPVNQTKWQVFYVKKGFSLALNSSNLRYKVVSDYDDLLPLPDGIYEIKQSYKPNTLTLNHFYHFRIIQLLVNIQEQRCKLLADRCNLEKREFYAALEQLRNIEDYAIAGKYMVEEDGDKEKGKELYKFAQTLLDQYSHECQC